MNVTEFTTVEDTMLTCNLLASQPEVSRTRLDRRGDTSCAEVAGRESAEKRGKVRRAR